MNFDWDMRMNFDWNGEKNDKLLAERGFNFETIVDIVERQGVLDDIENPNEESFPHQRALIVAVDNYAVFVPYVMDGDTMFLKTAFRSRRFQKKYLGSRTP